MTGPIIPGDRPSGRYSVDDIREFLSAIEGTVWEVLPEAGDDEHAPRLRPYHVVDVDFLEAWCRHPKFHMVK